MKKSRIALVCFWMCLVVPVAGTVLIDPNGAGGFENGTTFSSNGWNLVNGEQASAWYLGTAPGGYTGNRCAHISRDGGSSWSYSGTLSTVHIYRDVVFPVGETDIRLTFDFNGVGMSTGAALRVYLVSFLTDVVAGIPLTSSPIGSSVYNQTGAWTQTGINIPSYYAGATQRLVFSWRNIGVEYTPDIVPIAIDKISLTSRIASPLAGTYSIDNTLPTSSDNFNSFIEAILALNGGGIAGPVTFNVSAGQVFDGLNPVLEATGTQANPITFQKGGIGPNPLLLSYGTGSSNDAVVSIKGGDYNTFECIDVSGQVVPLSGGYYMTSCENGFSFWPSAANQNAVKFSNLGITPGSANQRTLWTGVSMTNYTSPSSPEGANSHNTFSYLQISNCGEGIVITGTSSLYPDTGNKIEACIIGGEEPQSILGRSDYSSAGIRASGQSGLVVTRNEIRNVSNPGNKTYGIYLEGCLGESTVEGNYIHDITTPWQYSVKTATGMYLALHTQGTNRVWAYNNMVSGLSCGYTGSGTSLYGTYGIYMLGNGGACYLDFNSLRVDGAENVYSTGIYVADNTGINRITNNIITNYTVPQTNRRHYGVVFEDHATQIGAPGSLSDNNLIYLDNTNGGYPVRGAGVEYGTLSVWQDASLQDIHSFDVDPQLAGPQDLHIIYDSPAEDAGDATLTIDVLSNDIDGDTRLLSVNPYDIGCDEKNGPPGPPGPEVRIERVGNNVNLSWDPVPNALAYRIDSAPTPLGPFTRLGTSPYPDFLAFTTEERKFFQVTAVLD